MRETLIKHLEVLFNNYQELLDGLDEENLKAELVVPKNKTLGEHLWCVIGARESYAESLQAGEWAGFNSSLKREDIYSLEKVTESILSSSESALNTIKNITDWTDDRDELLINLLEHETMHEGQIIRLMYGLDKTLPQSWVERWA